MVACRYLCWSTLVGCFRVLLLLNMSDKFCILGPVYKSNFACAQSNAISKYMRSWAHEPGLISLNIYYKEFARQCLRELSSDVLWCRIRRTTVEYTQQLLKHVTDTWEHFDFGKNSLIEVDRFGRLVLTYEAMKGLLNLKLFTLFQPKRPKIIELPTDKPVRVN